MNSKRDDHLIGIPRLAAARVIGVTERRLRAWNQRGLVYPTSVSTVGSREIWIYTLEDLVQGRVVRELEERGIHILHIRRVVEAVRTSTHPKPLASLRWGVSRNEVFVGYPEGSWVGSKAPNQNVIIEVLDLDKIRNNARRVARQRPKDSAGHVESRRGKLGSKDVFAGTRVPVETVISYLERGATPARILEGFPNLRPEDIELAQSLAV